MAMTSLYSRTVDSEKKMTWRRDYIAFNFHFRVGLLILECFHSINVVEDKWST